MSAYPENPTYKTLNEALTNSYRVNTLRTLAKMVCKEIPARKADIVSANLQGHAGIECNIPF